MTAVPETFGMRLRRLPTGIGGAVFWLAIWSGILWLVRQAPSMSSPVLGWMQTIVAVAMFGLAVPLTLKIVRQRFLWSLRSKLILTYLLIGLAPVLLFLTLVLISTYLAVGQFSIHLADTRMQQHLDEIGLDNASRVSRIAQIMRQLAEHPPPTLRRR